MAKLRNTSDITQNVPEGVAAGELRVAVGGDGGTKYNLCKGAVRSLV
jgi:hypothetical protein